MNDTRTNRKKREEIIIPCIKKLADLEFPDGKTYEYRIETWTKDDPEPVAAGKSGIRITITSS